MLWRTNESPLKTISILSTCINLFQIFALNPCYDDKNCFSVVFTGEPTQCAVVASPCESQFSFLKAEPAELISSALWYRQANVQSSGRMSSGLKGQY